MLNSLRNFTKSFWAKILLVIIIIPFVFWGMGSVFSGGSTNTLAKINKHNVSTKEFMDHLNTLRINTEVIRENIDNSIVENLLSDLINTKILNLESKELNIIISDTSLYEIIKKNEKFFDKDSKFSRTKYEKFLITNNISAAQYERRVRKDQKDKLLFNYISGGTLSPNFLIKKTYNYKNRKVNVDAINLNSIYKKDGDFNELSIKKYIEDNQEKLKENFLSFRYAIVNPLILIDSDEFNELFFKKIDEIENSIINEKQFGEIVKEYKLQSKKIDLINKDLSSVNGEVVKNIEKELVDKIYEIKFKKINDIHLVEFKNEYGLIVIDEIEETIPNIMSKSFRKKIIRSLINRDIFETNNKIMNKILKKNYSDDDFIKLAKKNNINVTNVQINGINDNNFFSRETNEKIFKLAEKNFTIINEIEKNKVFLISLKQIEEPNFSKTITDYKKYYYETTVGLKKNIYSSYDNYINNKYKVEINHKTLDRVKNYFR